MTDGITEAWKGIRKHETIEPESLNTITKIKVEKIIILGKEVECYIPTILGVNCMGSGYILKESKSNEGIITDNYQVAENILNIKYKEFDNFIKENNDMLVKYFLYFD